MSNLLKSAILHQARAGLIPTATCGAWSVRRWYQRDAMTHINGGVVPCGVYTALCRQTLATIHLEKHPGETVMEDTPPELLKHMDFMLRAHGDVLVSGLGLGCVARGLLVNPAVRSVTVLELSRDVLYLVGRHMKFDRLELIETDALEWIRQTDRRFDAAWHDVWMDEPAGEEPLAIFHSRLFEATQKKAGFQGAWAYPRFAKRLYRRKFNMVG